MNFLTGDKRISIVQDPFKRKCIKGISMHISQGIGDAYYAWGYVEFKNGQTEGKQSFRESDFDIMFEKMKAFIETL